MRLSPYVAMKTPQSIVRRTWRFCFEAPLKFKRRPAVSFKYSVQQQHISSTAICHSVNSDIHQNLNHTPIKVQCCFVTSPISCLRPCRTGWSINCRDRISSSSLNYWVLPQVIHGLAIRHGTATIHARSPASSCKGTYPDRIDLVETSPLLISGH